MITRQQPYFTMVTNSSDNQIYNRSGEQPALLSEQTQDGITTQCYRTKEGAEVSVVLQPAQKAKMTRQYCIVQNGADKPLRLNSVSSLYVEGIGTEAGADWCQEGRFVVHSCQMAWQGEGQWRHNSLFELGLYPTYNHHTQTKASFRCVGSWTTSELYPMLLLEDRLEKKIWYFELEAVGSWYMEINAKGENPKDGLTVYLSCAYDKNDGWTEELQPGESYRTLPAFYGVTDGGFEEGLRELTVYKRETSRTGWPEGIIPVCFNDYMDCLWGQPSLERELPLIDAAAAAGVEIFCIDAGWYRSAAGDWGGIGDYEPADAKFGADGLQGVLDAIRAKGMRPGVWLEMEACQDSTAMYQQLGRDGLLTRYGDIIGGSRAFYDFRKEPVRTHFRRVYAMLYRMGVRYIKNDYNQSVGIGCDGDRCLSDGLRANQEAFLAFIREIKETYPDMIIENCGSGAMRCNHATLSKFWLQSVSDQEYFEYNPSIVSGSMACYPPEKAGVWSYPYPVAYPQRASFQPDEQFVAAQTDGLQTVANMATAMLGCIYLSGRIDCADAKNAALIREAVEVYKRKVRALIPQSVPVYPQGTFRMTESGVRSFGLLQPEKKTLLLAVWNLGGEPAAEVDVSRYVGTDCTVQKLYPSLTEISCTAQNGKLTVRFPAKRTAALLLVQKA